MTSDDSFPGSFILCLPRTGSTALRLILDTHPEIYCPDEVNLGLLTAHLFHTLEGLRESPTTRAMGWQNVEAGDPILAEAAGKVAELMDTFLRQKGKRIWCDKSPTNIEKLDFVGRAYPRAKFILLHRHCLDVAMSCLRVSPYGFSLPVFEDFVRRNHRGFVPALVQAWEENTAALLRFEERMGAQALRVRYEDLVAAPAATLERICSFLGVGFDPGVLERAFATPHHQRAFGGDPGAMLSAGLVDRSVGSGAEIRWVALKAVPSELRSRMNERLQELGYPPVAFLAEGFDMGMARAERAPARPAETGAGPAGGIAHLFENLLPMALAARPEVAAEVGASFRFLVTGDGGGSWVVDLTQTPGRVVAGDGEAQCEITLPAADVVAILSGAVNPVQPFQEGRARMAGEVPLASLQRLFSLMAAPSP
jgi:protein-tyrosine sulfotransferase